MAQAVGDVRYWEADIGLVYKETVGVSLELWHFGEKAWVPAVQDDVANWDQRKYAGECEVIDATALPALGVAA